jgi:hypothetical protein
MDDVGSSIGGAGKNPLVESALKSRSLYKVDMMERKGGTARTLLMALLVLFMALVVVTPAAFG